MKKNEEDSEKEIILGDGHDLVVRLYDLDDDVDEHLVSISETISELSDLKFKILKLIDRAQDAMFKHTSSVVDQSSAVRDAGRSIRRARRRAQVRKP